MLFGLLLAAEHLLPLRQRKNRVLARLPVNLVMTGLVFAAGSLLVGPAAMAAAEWGAERRIGLCHVVPLPFWGAAILAVVLMDLTFYYWHRANHKISLLWRFHNVHHSAVITETDSNYSVLFSWWDRLHGTLILNIHQSAIDVGVPAYQGPRDNRLGLLLTAPFIKQRDYWRGADGARSAGNQCSAIRATRMLA